MFSQVTGYKYLQFPLYKNANKKTHVQLIKNSSECQAQDLRLAVVSVFLPCGSFNTLFNLLLLLREGLIQHCPWKSLCCSLPTPAPSNAVLAHCLCDCRVNQNRDRIEITGEKKREQGWVESLQVYGNKAEEMVEEQEPVLATEVDLVHIAWENVCLREMSCCV